MGANLTSRSERSSSCVVKSLDDACYKLLYVNDHPYYANIVSYTNELPSGMFASAGYELHQI
jgi:hypothetical protein